MSKTRPYYLGKRSHWLVTVRWDDICLDGLFHGQQQVTFKFPGSWPQSDVYEAAADRWDRMDWTPSENQRASATYRATAKLIRETDIVGNYLTA